MVARKLLLLLLFAFQTWTPAEAIQCYSKLATEIATSSCQSDKFCHYKEDGQHPHGRITLLCKPDKYYSGTSRDNDMNEICEEAERIQLNTPGYRQIIQDTKNWCFSPIYQEGYRADVLFCCTRSENMNHEYNVEDAVQRYQQMRTTMPSLAFDQWQTTTTTTRRTTTTTRRTTTTTRPTTTTTRRTTTITTPTTTPTTTTTPPTTTTSPPTTTTTPPTTTTRRTTTTTPKPTTTHIKPTSSNGKPTPIKPTPTKKPTANAEKSTTTAFDPSMSPGSTVSVVNPENESPAPLIQCHEKENMDGSADGGQLCEGRFCLIAIGSNDSYASGCADSSGMAKVNETLDSPLDYSTFCQGLSSDSEEACVRCEDRKTKTGNDIKICCTNKEQSNTLDTVKKNVTCKPASSKDQSNEKSSLVIIIVVILLVVLFLIILVIVIIIVVRKKSEKPKKKKKGKKGGKKSKKPEKSARTIGSSSLPTDNTTVGASPTIGGTSTIGGSPTTTTGTVDDPISKMTIGNTTSDNTTRGNITLLMEDTNTNATTTATPSAPRKQTGGAKIAKSSTPDKKIAKSSTPDKKIAKSSTTSKKPATRKPSTATTKTSQGNTSDVASTFAL